ncbi:MAG: YARHG domain-containing protein [Alphaproteobacteria bacterium]|nr:YARHG domain-containing protein [Alphaproteobacteria bacterium]
MRRLTLIALTLSALVACGGDDPEPAPPAPEAPVTQPAAPEAPPEAAAPEAPAATGPVRQTWEALLAAGCDFNKVPVHTPVEARILRNTPFALAGYRFKDINLRLLYQADGGWYTPKLDEAPELDGVTKACVDALKAKEEALKEAMPIPDELAARMTRDHALFKVLREWGSRPTSPYADPNFHHDEGEDSWSMFTRDPECEPQPESECGGYSVYCPSETPCQGIAAG